MALSKLVESLLIKPRTKLSRELRRTIDTAYRGAIKEIGEEEFFYIGKNLSKKLDAVLWSSTSWVRDVGQRAELLHRLYKEHSEGKLELSDAALRRLGASLFYFINPFDIIPDHIVGRGYLDDAYIINKCIQFIGRKHPRILSRFAAEE